MTWRSAGAAAAGAGPLVGAAGAGAAVAAAGGALALGAAPPGAHAASRQPTATSIDGRRTVMIASSRRTPTAPGRPVPMVADFAARGRLAGRPARPGKPLRARPAA